MEDKRNYGIDFLRIMSMVFVVILHALGRGGLLLTTEYNSMQYKFTWFMEIFVYCAVNIFALISGYVAYSPKEKKMKFSKLVMLWFEIVFYELLVTITFNILKPEAVIKDDYISALMPLSNKLYWYFSAYVGLFLLMPIINKAINNCSVRTLKKTFIVIIIAFSIFDTVIKGFELVEGYSVIWLVLLYILGSIMKKCEIGKNIRTCQALLGIVILTVATYLWKIYGIENINSRILDRNLLISYISPTILLSAILYIIAFSKVKFNNIIKIIIKFLAPGTFAIYILNSQKFIWDYIMRDTFVFLYESSLIKIFIFIVGFSLMFALIAMLIDRIRMVIFKLCRIDKLSKKIEEILDKTVDKIASLI